MRKRLSALAIAILALFGATSQASASFRDLLDATRANDTALARQLIAEGTDPNGGPSGFPDSYAPLMWAARHGNLELIRLLLDAGAGTERRDFNGDRALLWAAAAGQADAIALLLAAGSPTDSPDDPYGQTPLMLAARSAWPEAARILIEAGAALDARDQSGGTALHEAVLSQSPETVRLLLRAGADPNIADTILGETPLHIAAARQKADIVAALLEAGARTAIWDEAGKAPLVIAAARGLPDNVAALLAAGADPSLPDPQGRTALRAAIEGKPFEFVDNDAAAALLVPLTPDATAEFAASVSAGMPRTALALLSLGADPDQRMLDGHSVLAGAAMLEHPALFDAIVAAGTGLQQSGADALFAAAAANRIIIVERLLALGIAVDVADIEGGTPLLAAAQAGAVEMVRFLLARGAQPISPDHVELAEFTPFELWDEAGGEQSAVLDPGDFRLRAAIEELRRRQSEARAILAAAI